MMLVAAPGAGAAATREPARRQEPITPSPSTGVAPASVTAQVGTLDLFDESATGSVEHTAWSSQAGWGETESLGGSPTSGPAASSSGTGLLEVFARGQDNALWE